MRWRRGGRARSRGTATHSAADSAATEAFRRSYLHAAWKRMGQLREMLEGVHQETEYEVDLTGTINWQRLLHLKHLALHIYTQVLRWDLPVLVSLSPIGDVAAWVKTLPRTLQSVRPVVNYDDPDPDDRALLECLARVRAWETTLGARIPPMLSIFWPYIAAFLLGVLSSVVAEVFLRRFL